MCTDCRDMYSGLRDERIQSTSQSVTPNLMGDSLIKGYNFFFTLSNLCPCKI